MAKSIKPRSVDQCQALRSNGYPCGNKATIQSEWMACKGLGHHNRSKEVKMEPLQLCWHHQDWTPDKHKGLTFRNRRLSEKEKAERKKAYQAGREKCIYPNKGGGECLSPVARRDEAQNPYCYYHWRQFQQATPEQQSLMHQRMIEAGLFRAAGKPLSDEQECTSGKKMLVQAMPSIEEQLAAVEELSEQRQNALKIQFKEEPKPPGVRHKKDTVGSNTKFMGVDVDYYTPDFKYDYLYLLFNQIRRSEALVQILYQQLMRIEQEEDELKVTETEGTMMNAEGNPVQFSNRTTRHVTPIETKLLLVDKLTKQESHLAKLLKQLEELPLTCLTVFKQMGVKWDAKAAQMVIEAIEQERMKTMEGYTDVDIKALPSKLEEVQTLVHRTIEQNVIPDARKVQLAKPETNW